MATVTLTAQNFDEIATGEGITFVDWWASWCGPCRAFAPVFENASETHPDITFGKVDTEAEQRLAAAAGIQSIPTLMIFREGVLIFSQPGALPPAALDDLIDQARGLDMQEVHAAIAEQQQQAAGDGV